MHCDRNSRTRIGRGSVRNLKEITREHSGRQSPPAPVRAGASVSTPRRPAPARDDEQQLPCQGRALSDPGDCESGDRERQRSEAGSERPPVPMQDAGTGQAGGAAAPRPSRASVGLDPDSSSPRMRASVKRHSPAIGLVNQAGHRVGVRKGLGVRVGEGGLSRLGFHGNRIALLRLGVRTRTPPSCSSKVQTGTARSPPRNRPTQDEAPVARQPRSLRVRRERANRAEG
jgi:hypothetical protein